MGISLAVVADQRAHKVTFHGRKARITSLQRLCISFKRFCISKGCLDIPGRSMTRKERRSLQHSCKAVCCEVSYASSVLPFSKTGIEALHIDQ